MVPSGTYERVDKDGRMVTVPGTYQQVEKVYLGPQWLMIAPIKGFLDGALIIAFLLVIGGAFSVIQATGTIEFAIRRITAALDRAPRAREADDPGADGRSSRSRGSVFGMAEETIPFILIFVPLALSLGYDSIVGVVDPVPRRRRRLRRRLLQPVHGRRRAGPRRPAALLRARLPRHHLVRRHRR